MSGSRKSALALVIAAAAVTLAAPSALAATSALAAAKPVKYPNCAALNRTYPHGVAVRVGVKDKVTKGARPVTNYAVNKAVYQANAARLDRDKDGIACEKL